jgi:hypothetical protein
MTMYPGEWYVGLALIVLMAFLVGLTVLWGRRHW